MPRPSLAADGNDGRGMFYYAASAQRQEEFYSPNMFLCPSARPDILASLRPQFSIAMNSKLGNKIQPFVKLSCTARPDRTALFLDAGVLGETPLPGQAFDGRPHVFAKGFSGRHAGRGNISFFDGHVEPLPIGKVVTDPGPAFFPQDLVQWTCDPETDPNQ